MTIKELIETLSQFEPDTPVVVGGYEGGYNDISLVTPKTMQLNVNDKHYYGAHDCVKGLIIPGKPMRLKWSASAVSIPTVSNQSFFIDEFS